MFSGVPVDYSDFVRGFENLIERKTSSPNSRLYYLVQYTSGEVKELMQSCLCMKPEEGYKTPRALLKDRYGQSYKIATALVDQVRKSPQIKADDGPALLCFTVLLTLQRIIGRLLMGLRQRWWKRLTASLRIRKSHHQRHYRNPLKGNTDPVQTKSDFKCPLCKANHWLQCCGVFRGNSVDEQIKLVRSRGLCHNCLMPGQRLLAVR